MEGLWRVVEGCGGLWRGVEGCGALWSVVEGCGGYGCRNVLPQVFSEPVKWQAKARVDHNNVEHKPGGGNVVIHNEKLQWKAEPVVPRARSSVSSGSGEDMNPNGVRLPHLTHA